jgi:hypothetical protein
VLAWGPTLACNGDAFSSGDDAGAGDDGALGEGGGEAGDDAPSSGSPTLTAASPPLGASAGGVAVTLTGAGFVSGATVTFAAAPATVTSVTPTTIVATLPPTPGPIGYVPVAVKNPGGATASNAKIFRYTSVHASFTPGGVASITDGLGYTVQALTSVGLHDPKKPDLVTSLFAGSHIADVLPNTGNGTFGAVQIAGTSGFAGSFAAGDFNEDMHADVVFMTADGQTLGLLTGSGSGSLTQSTWAASLGGLSQVVAGDFNGDGHLDLVAAQGSSLLTLLGHGQGTFDAPHAFATGLGAFTGFGVGDMNGDGKLDVVVASAQQADAGVSSEASVLLGHGDGTFGLPKSEPTGFAPQGIALADFDGNGHLDVATLDGTTSTGVGTNVHVIAGDGAGGLGAITTTPSGWTSGMGNLLLVAADFNGDTTPDLALESGEGHVSILLDDGLGKLTQGALYQLSQFFPAGTFAVSTQALLTDDFDGDGMADLAVGGGPTTGKPPAVIGILLGHVAK